MCKFSVTSIPDKNWGYSKEEVCKSQLASEYSNICVQMRIMIYMSYQAYRPDPAKKKEFGMNLSWSLELMLIAVGFK